MNTESSLLECSFLGKHLTQPQLQELLRLGATIDLSPRQYLFREGEENRYLFVLLSGKLDLTMTVPGRSACRILTLSPGDLVAWSALVGDGTMTCSAVGIEPSKLLAIHASSIDAIIETDSTFGYHFMKMLATALSRRLLATRLQLLDLFRSPT